MEERGGISMPIIMHTTNIIEGLNCQCRKVTKTKSVFPSDNALEKPSLNLSSVI